MRTSITSKQIQLIRQSFSLVSPTDDAVPRALYERMFEIEPRLRAMFPPCLKEQGRKLMRMLGTAIGMLDRPDDLLLTLHTLGRSHSSCGVRDEHYEPVGKALLAALEQGLGWAFTPEVREAWIAFYRIVAATMQNGAKLELTAET